MDDGGTTPEDFFPSQRDYEDDDLLDKKKYLASVGPEILSQVLPQLNLFASSPVTKLPSTYKDTSVKQDNIRDRFMENYGKNTLFEKGSSGNGNGETGDNSSPNSGGLPKLPAFYNAGDFVNYDVQKVADENYERSYNELLDKINKAEGKEPDDGSVVVINKGLSRNKADIMRRYTQSQTHRQSSSSKDRDNGDHFRSQPQEGVEGNFEEIRENVGGQPATSSIFSGSDFDPEDPSNPLPENFKFDFNQFDVEIKKKDAPSFYGKSNERLKSFLDKKSRHTETLHREHRLQHDGINKIAHRGEDSPGRSRTPPPIIKHTRESQYADTIRRNYKGNEMTPTPRTPMFPINPRGEYLNHTYREAISNPYERPTVRTRIPTPEPPIRSTISPRFRHSLRASRPSPGPTVDQLEDPNLSRYDNEEEVFYIDDIEQDRNSGDEGFEFKPDFKSRHSNGQGTLMKKWNEGVTFDPLEFGKTPAITFVDEEEYSFKGKRPEIFSNQEDFHLRDDIDIDSASRNNYEAQNTRLREHNGLQQTTLISIPKYGVEIHHIQKKKQQEKTNDGGINYISLDPHHHVTEEQQHYQEQEQEGREEHGQEEEEYHQYNLNLLSEGRSEQEFDTRDHNTRHHHENNHASEEDFKGRHRNPTDSPLGRRFVGITEHRAPDIQAFSDKDIVEPLSFEIPYTLRPTFESQEPFQGMGEPPRNLEFRESYDGSEEEEDGFLLSEEELAMFKEQHPGFLDTEQGRRFLAEGEERHFEEEGDHHLIEEINIEDVDPVAIRHSHLPGENSGLSQQDKHDQLLTPKFRQNLMQFAQLKRNPTLFQQMLQNQRNQKVLLALLRKLKRQGAGGAASNMPKKGPKSPEVVKRLLKKTIMQQNLLKRKYLAAQVSENE